MTEALISHAWECLAETAEYYYRKLSDAPQILSFLKERFGFTKAIIRKYRIGYAENSGLFEHLSCEGFSLKEMVASGAFRPDDRNRSDISSVFENQVVFPFILKGRTVFMTALKQRWIKDFLFPEYRKLPIYDSRDLPWVAKAIDGKILYNQQILDNQPDFLIITENIPDCIMLDHYGFPAVSSADGTIAKDDWEWIIPKVSGIKKTIFWQNDRITKTGWESMLQAAQRLRKEKIAFLVTQPSLEKKHRAARERLRKYGISPGITSGELKGNMEERSLNEYNEIQSLIAESEIDICSFFMSGKTVADVQHVLDRALLPAEIKDALGNPADIFLSELKELLRTNRAKILERYAKEHKEQGIPVIGYYKENKKYVCLIPQMARKTIRNNCRLKNEVLDFSTITLSRGLFESGYIKKPTRGKNLTGRERIPGKGRTSAPERVWKIDASLLYFDQHSIA